MASPQHLQITDFTYHLPADKIALYPPEIRGQSRLLHWHQGVLADVDFAALPDLLPPGSGLVLNSSRVVHARLQFRRDSGGRIEVFCLEAALPEVAGRAVWRCLVGNSRKWKSGEVLTMKTTVGNLRATLLGHDEGHFRVQFDWDSQHVFFEMLQQAGHVPLPPYLNRPAEAGDDINYQTVYARQPGSVAAPTAGLHFTPQLLETLARQQVQAVYLTLHVGAGTFRPVKSETMAGHHMHGEWIQATPADLQAICRLPQLTAVGTTSLRMLETLYWVGVKVLHRLQVRSEQLLGQWEAYSLPQDVPSNEALQACANYAEANGGISGVTEILIAPGYRIRTARRLLTNFHQPGSTLLLLVAAFAGNDWKRIYDHALQNGYRFLSYGDACLLEATLSKLGVDNE